MKHPKSVLIISSALTLGACTGGGDQHDHPELTTGKQLFEHHCATCHSSDGHGNLVKGIPPNRATSLSRQQISSFVRKSSPNKPRTMPVFEKMSKAEADKIARHLMDLKKEWLKQQM